MFRSVLSIFTGILILSCGQRPDKPELNTHGFKSDHVSLKGTNSKDSAVSRINSIDLLLNDYMRYSENDLVTLARRGNLAEEALFDKKEKRGFVTFHVFQIGHDLTDGDGKRFITDSWVYIDSARGNIYEYDMIKDSLIEWDGNSVR